MSILSKRHIRAIQNPWVLSSILIASGISIPLVFVLTGLFQPLGTIWEHFVEHLLLQYLGNTLGVILLVAIFSILFGVSAAWLVSNYQFKGKSFIEIGLILPLAIPSYIAAYAYVGLFDINGLIHRGIESIGMQLSTDIMNLPMISFILAAVLYPYVFIIARASFQMQSATLLEVGASLGLSKAERFRRIALPLARPAIIGGVSLVVMEVLNDYGAVKYFGINTFTTGIFKAWFSMGEPILALRMAGILLLIVFVVMYMERKSRKQDTSSTQIKNLDNAHLHAAKWFHYLIVLLPIIAGFILPVTQLVLWAVNAFSYVWDNQFVELIMNSVSLALGTSLLCVIVAIVLAYTQRVFPISLMKVVSQFAVIGYAIPGAIIAIGVLMPFTSFNLWLIDIFSLESGLFLSKLFISITFAYMVRFMAVSFNAVDSGFNNLSGKENEAARSLGLSPLKALLKVDLPILKWPLIAAALMVFIDVLKELPLTLILRPFNYHSLATRTYEYAGDEMIQESSVPALIIVLLGALASFLLNKLIAKK